MGVVACIGAGAWLAFSTALPLVWQYGAILGALAAPLLISTFCRTLCHRTSAFTGANDPRPS